MTSKDFLSQEEIDALLKQTESISSGEPVVQTVDDYLTPLEQDALGEIGNITFGSAATALSTLLGNKVEITTPKISIIKRSQFEQEFPKPHVTVHVTYVDGFEGINSLVIKKRDAQVIADLMLGGEGNPENEELNEIHISAVQEAMNQMMGSAATSMSTVFNKKVDISPPSIDLMNISKNEGRDNIPEDDLLVKVSFRLRIGNLIDSNLMQLLPLKFSQNIVKSLLGETEAIEEPVAATMQATPVAPPPPVAQPAAPVQPVYQQPAPPIQQPVYQEQQTIHTSQRAAQPVNVQQAQFASFDTNVITESEARNLNMLLDIPLQVTVELGRTKRSVKEILDLSSGSIIELDKLAGEPVDILVNSRLIAKGEVVVIDENFGVRITDVLSQAERLNNLR